MTGQFAHGNVRIDGFCGCLQGDVEKGAVALSRISRNRIDLHAHSQERKEQMIGDLPGLPLVECRVPCGIGVPIPLFHQEPAVMRLAQVQIRFPDQLPRDPARGLVLSETAVIPGSVGMPSVGFPGTQPNGVMLVQMGSARACVPGVIRRRAVQCRHLLRTSPHIR